MTNVINEVIARTTFDFETAGKAANTMFEQLWGGGHDWGFPSVVATTWDNELKANVQVAIDANHKALITALNTIPVNGHSSNPWLHATIQSVVGLEMEDMSPVEELTKFLTAHDLIEKRPVVENVLAGGKVRQRKVWPLTAKWKEILTSHASVRPKIKPLDASIRQQIGDIVKGASKASMASVEAIDKLDMTAFQFIDETMDFCKAANKALDAEKILPVKNQYGEVVTPASVVYESKLREILAVRDEFRERGLKPFYLTHTQDHRGRIYARGGQISTQSGKLQKAVIRFAEPERACDINTAEILIYLGRLAGCKGTVDEAMIAGAKEKANPTCWESKAVLADMARAIIRLDGSCNGIQWMSAFSNDPIGMELTNLIGDQPKDLYSAVQKNLGLRTRDFAKAVVMPRGYGATAWSIQRSLAEKGLMVSEKEVAIWLDQLSEVLPIDKFLRHITSNAGYSDRDEFTWIMPDGFKVVHSYTTGDKLTAGDTFSVSVNGGRRDDRKMVGALAPNIIHSIDAYHARLIITQCDFQVVPIHDSFGCHSSNVPALRRVIRDTFQQILREDVMNSIMEQLGFDGFADPADPSIITNPYMFA